MSKQPKLKKKVVQRPATAVLGGMWVGSVLSLGLLYIAGDALLSDLKAFRACSSNSNGLVVNNCGKQSFNPGDAVLLGLFILAAFLALSVCTAALRATKGKT
jgi:hypothetical protein